MSKKNNSEKSAVIRLDKWLWAARFYKTRAIAKQMIDGGKVRYNGQHTKSGKSVFINDLISIKQGFDEKEVRVVALAEIRRDATFAQTLYEETPDSIATREKISSARKLGVLLSPASEKKPDKKQRRALLKFKDRI